MKKRMISGALALCLALSLLPVGAMAAGANPFTDVPVNHWATDAVTDIYDRGLMNGTDAAGKTFSPDGATTRGMIWTILARYAGEDTSGGSVWYAAGQSWAMETGVSDGTDPNGAITREQLVAMLYRFVDSPSVSGSLARFPDGGQVSGYAKNAMIWAVDTGLITGTDGGRLDPGGKATRAQTAVILSRFCAAYPAGGVVSAAQMIRNLRNSTLAKRETLAAMAEVMLEDGLAPAFVAGALGNIIEEGACGVFESSAYLANPEAEPAYLVYMDENYDYREKYSGKYIYNGISLSEVQAMVDELGAAGANGNGSCFGLGCMQWTHYNRLNRLLKNYQTVAGSADTITKEQCFQAEGMTISQEFSGSYKKVYTAWQEENPEQDNADAAYAAGVIVCTRYGVPVGYNTEAVQAKRGFNSADIYAVMMGE